VNLPEIKQYLRIEHDEDDQLIESMKTMAETYIANSIGDVDKEQDLYRFAVVMLIGHWYETREIARIGNNSYNIPHAFDSIILQLKYCQKEGEDL